MTDQTFNSPRENILNKENPEAIPNKELENKISVPDTEPSKQVPREVKQVNLQPEATIQKIGSVSVEPNKEPISLLVDNSAVVMPTSIPTNGIIDKASPHELEDLIFPAQEQVASIETNQNIKQT
jgi:hypothetical protein